MRVPIRAVATALLLLALFPGSVAAHAELLNSTPKADSVLITLPPSIALTYSEPLLPTSSVEVVDSAGSTVAKGSVDPADPHDLVATLSTLPNGRYEVRWTAATDDSHIERGTFTFTVAIATLAPATEAPSTPAASPAAGETPTPVASSPASAAPTAAPAGSPGDAASLGDVLIPIVV
ncbi:MAG: copper resistance CopC family protein, partial [Chloroflexota bacterium]